MSEISERAENQGVKCGWWFGAGLFMACLAIAAAELGGLPNVAALLVLGAGSAALGVAGRAAWRARRRHGGAVRDGRLGAALDAWGRGDVTALEAALVELAGEPAAAHALRTASLCAELAGQLALLPEDAGALALAAGLHVLSPAIEGSPCEAHCGPAAAGGNTAAHLETIVAAPVAAIAREVGDRWDRAGEATSLPGRMLAAACPFDIACAGGLERGLRVLREGSGSAYDPLVVAELTHLFRKPWPLDQAA